jgi:hypothetical protein
MKYYDWWKINYLLWNMLLFCCICSYNKINSNIVVQNSICRKNFNLYYHFIIQLQYIYLRFVPNGVRFQGACVFEHLRLKIEAWIWLLHVCWSFFWVKGIESDRTIHWFFHILIYTHFLAYLKINYQGLGWIQMCSQFNFATKILG